MRTFRHSLLLALLFALPAFAQDQATTLLAACRRADVVVTATVLASTDPSPDWHRLEFRTDQVLKGQPGAQFAVLEPSGACCGRSLFSLRVQDRCVLFLQRRGATLHPFGGGRGVLGHEPELVAHVQELLAANDDGARARLLARSLEHGTARIADDAAQALATLPSLVLAASERSAIRSALAAAVQHGRTTSAPLLEAAIRLQDATTLDALLPLYLGTDRADQASLLRQGLARCTAEQVIDRLPLHLHNDEQGQLRAAELLADLPAGPANGALRSMLGTTNNPRVLLCVTESLLADGSSAASLQHAVPLPVLQLAEQRRQRARTFRSLATDRR